MIDPRWKPSDILAIEIKWKNVRLPVHESISTSEAERLMVAYQAISEDWLNQMANAVLYKETLKWKREAAYNMAFLSSEASSDRQRDIIAKSDSQVKSAELALIEASATLKLLEGRYESSVRSHHAMKDVYKQAAAERTYG